MYTSSVCLAAYECLPSTLSCDNDVTVTAVYLTDLSSSTSMLERRSSHWAPNFAIEVTAAVDRGREGEGEGKRKGRGLNYIGTRERGRGAVNIESLSIKSKYQRSLGDQNLSNSEVVTNLMFG